MRSLNPVNVRQCVAKTVAAIGVSRLSRLRNLLVLVSLAATAALAPSVFAEGITGAPPKPQIINFEVTFDGFDQFYVSGQVVGVAQVDGLTVEFDDYLSGLSTETAYGGYFGMIFVSSDAEYETFSARVTSAEGVQSDYVRDWIW